jgi:hypothetical protein
LENFFNNIFSNKLALQKQFIVKMSSSVVSSIRIVSLPMEFQTQDGVIDLVENVLQLGSVASVSLTENYTAVQVRYLSATVDLSSQGDSVNACHVFSTLEDDGSKSVQIECDVPIHWNNGKPMGYVSIRRANLVSTFGRGDAPIMPLEVDSWMSIYIPVIPNDLSISSGSTVASFKLGDLQSLIENKLRLGKVKRVDFVSRPHSMEHCEVQSAFVHFESWYDLPYAAKVRDAMNASGSYRQKGYLDKDGFVAFVAPTEEGTVGRFLTFKINHKPIPDVKPEMNIEQLAAANAQMAKALEDKAARIAELEAQLSHEEGEVNGPMTVAELA